jgi:hypothetical protein
MMELDMEVHHHGAGQPVAAISTVADSLPGLGIVAAVLGVVITMGALGGPPEEIGKSGCAGRNFSGHSVVLRISRPDCGEHVQGYGRRARLLSRNSGGNRGVHQRLAAHDCRGIRAPCNPEPPAAFVSGV